jgi:hypothetical protein
VPPPLRPAGYSARGLARAGYLDLLRPVRGLWLQEPRPWPRRLEARSSSLPWIRRPSRGSRVAMRTLRTRRLGRPPSLPPAGQRCSRIAAHCGPPYRLLAQLFPSLASLQAWVAEPGARRCTQLGCRARLAASDTAGLPGARRSCLPAQGQACACAGVQRGPAGAALYSSMEHGIQGRELWRRARPRGSAARGPPARSACILELRARENARPLLLLGLAVNRCGPLALTEKGATLPRRHGPRCQWTHHSRRLPRRPAPTRRLSRD